MQLDMNHACRRVYTIHMNYIWSEAEWVTNSRGWQGMGKYGDT